jgi:predicted helicase
MEDPIIHFYETFLAEYDPKLRKARGVWYTPAPVVNFIVRAVDDILKTEFDLPQGLADTSKTKIKVNVQGKKIEKETHRVQILDPATGTGTFLAEVIKHVHKKFKGQEGIWSSYVENNLLPRLNGFELLMASYAMAHLQLDLLLKETGFKATTNQRTRVYLTNSLEEYHPDTGTLFANWLSSEANEANHIKRDTPVMCVIGNPPYAVSSTNKNNWIDSLIADYKKDLNEKSYNSLSDDYVKFIRYGQHFIEKNGSGVLAYISNNSFIDGIVFRKMRKHLLECFDKIYILDLHGNSKKKEVSPDGSADVNVFDIQQGVSINIFIKTDKKKKNELGQLFHYDLFGKREFKYDFLNENNLNSLKWNSLPLKKPNYFFINKNYQGQDEYKKGFSIDELFQIKAAGIKTHRDSVVIGFNKKELKEQIEDYLFSVDNTSNSFSETKFKTISYRPFDNRFIYFDTELVTRHREKQIRHSFLKNLSLISGRQTKNREICHFFISNTLSEMKTAESSTGSYHFQLYTYPETNAQQTIEQQEVRKANLNAQIVKQIEEKLGLTFTNEKEQSENTFAPIDILDYIYAVLYSPTYRGKYKEFLKIDFPKVPYPKDKDTFWQLVKLGGEIRQIHLLESPKVEQYITQYPIDGDNVVGKTKYQDGKVFINDTQYFDNVPQVAWEFYIGGYQPAQKWLKDRKERTLEFDDILHYQKIIVALSETDRIMKEIDKIEIE